MTSDRCIHVKARRLYQQLFCTTFCGLFIACCDI